MYVFMYTSAPFRQACCRVQYSCLAIQHSSQARSARQLPHLRDTIQVGGGASIYKEAASSMVTADAMANTMEVNSRAARESGSLRSHSHGESIAAP